MSYTAPNAKEAEEICTELTSLMVNENLKSIQAAAKGTSDVLSKEMSTLGKIWKI